MAMLRPLKRHHFLEKAHKANQSASSAVGGGVSFYDYMIGLGPVAAWRLGESSGAVLYDDVGGYDLTVTGSPTYGVPGLVAGDSNTAIQVGGTAAYASRLDVGLHFIGAAAQSFTVFSVIQKLDNGSGTLWGKDGSKDVWLALTGDLVVFHFYNGAYGETDLVTDGAINLDDGNPHTIAAIRDAAGNNRRVIIDGTNIYDQSLGSSYDCESGSAFTLMAQKATGIGPLLNTVYDDQYLYTYALSNAEVLEAHNLVIGA